MNAFEGIRIVIEGIRAATAGVQQDPQPTTFVLPAPAHVVKHDRLVQLLFHKQPLHDFHGDQVALVGFGAGNDQIAVGFRPAAGVEQAFAKVAGRQHRQQAELILPA